MFCCNSYGKTFEGKTDVVTFNHKSFLTNDLIYGLVDQQYQYRCMHAKFPT